MKKINTLIFTLSLVISAVGQNVGIGTVSPTSKLTVNGSQAIWNNNALTFFVDTGLSQKGYVGIAPSGGMTDLLLNSTAYGGWLRIGANDGPIQFYPNGNADVSSAYGVVGIYPSGNMGIGVNNPTYKLDVAGNGRFNAGGPTFVYVGPNGGGYYGDATNLLTQIPTGGNFYMSNNGIDGTRVAQADGSMRVGGPNQASANLYVYGGDVGIGTTSPLHRLHLITSGNTDGIIIQSTGSGSAPNLYFATYADVTAGVSHPGARIAAVDDDWSADITFSTKVPGADANAMTERMRLLNNGNVGIGTSTPLCLMDVEGNTNNSGTVTGAAGYVGYFKNGGTSNSGAILVNIASNVNSCRYMECEVNGSEVGCLYGNGSNALNVYSASDRRLKKNIRNTTMGIGEIMQIPVRDYEWNADGTTVSAGFIAQELYKIYPGAVLKGGEGDLSSQPGTTWMVNYASLTPLIVKSIQDQQHIIEDQKVEIEQLRKEISELRSSSASPADIDKLKASVETLQQMMQIKAQK